MNADAAIQSAWRLWQNGDLAGATDAARDLLAGDPACVEAWRLLARAALAQGLRDRALEILEEGFGVAASSILADDIAAWHLQGRDAEAARPWLERAQDLDSNLSAARTYQFAVCDWLAGEYTTALSRFEEAHALEPDDARYTVRLARALASLGRSAEAASCLRSFYPRTLPPAGQALLALCTFDLDGEKAALAVVEQGRKEQAGNPLLDFLHAALLQLRGRPNDIDPSALANLHADPRVAAYWEGFRHALSQAPRPGFHGLDGEVLIRAIELAPAEGSVLEFGVYRGLSLRFIAERMAGPIHGFDSFQGLPEAWKPGEGAGSYSTRGALPDLPANVTLHAGWFEDTMPAFFAENAEPIKLLHIDCDLYGSTKTVLQHARPRLVPGSVVVFDEYAGYPGYRDHEFRAWHEFVHAHDIRRQYLAFALTAKKAAIRILG